MGKYNTKNSFFGNGKNDECYTPIEPVLAIQKHNIHKDAIIWCPFDTEGSEFVKVFSKTNKVEFSHISMGKNAGKDFFKYQPDNWDVMISNPPFTSKALYFERALKLGKPFALIMTVAWLNDARLFKMFRAYGRHLQFLWFTSRINFDMPFATSKGNMSFGSAFICYNMLGTGNIIADLKDFDVKQPKLF